MWLAAGRTHSTYIFANVWATAHRPQKQSTRLDDALNGTSRRTTMFSWKQLPQCCGVLFIGGGILDSIKGPENGGIEIELRMDILASAWKATETERGREKERSSERQTGTRESLLLGGPGKNGVVCGDASENAIYQ